MDGAGVHPHDDLWMLHFLGVARWMHPSGEAIRDFQVGPASMVTSREGEEEQA